jgi:hypothetical protein
MATKIIQKQIKILLYSGRFIYYILIMNIIKIVMKTVAASMLSSAFVLVSASSVAAADSFQILTQSDKGDYIG